MYIIAPWIEHLKDAYKLSSENSPRYLYFIPSVVILDILLTLLLSIILMCIFYILPEEYDDSEDYVEMVKYIMSYPIYFLIVIGLVYPLIETFIGQLCIIEILRLYIRKKWVIVVLSAFIFSVMHLFFRRPIALVTTFPGSVLLSFVYVRIRPFSFPLTVLNVFLVHAIHNMMTVFAVLYLGKTFL